MWPRKQHAASRRGPPFADMLLFVEIFCSYKDTSLYYMRVYLSLYKANLYKSDNISSLIYIAILKVASIYWETHCVIQLWAMGFCL